MRPVLLILSWISDDPTPRSPMAPSRSRGFFFFFFFCFQASDRRIRDTAEVWMSVHHCFRSAAVSPSV